MLRQWRQTQWNCKCLKTSSQGKAQSDKHFHEVLPSFHHLPSFCPYCCIVVAVSRVSSIMILHSKMTGLPWSKDLQTFKAFERPFAQSMLREISVRCPHISDWYGWTGIFEGQLIVNSFQHLIQSISIWYGFWAPAHKIGHHSKMILKMVVVWSHTHIPPILKTMESMEICKINNL